MKKASEIAAMMEAKYAEIAAAGDFETQKSLMDEFDSLKKQKELAEKMEAAEKAMVAEKAPVAATAQASKEEPRDSVHEFAMAARNGFRAKTMSEGTNSAGGYTVPEDISTQIEHLRDAEFSLRELVTVTNVRTLHGERTYRSRATQTGFSQVSEAGAIGAKDTPTFARYEYNIKKYAGYFPVTNELLDDTDANIVGELTSWIGNEARATDNAQILAALNLKYTRTSSPETAKTISGIDSIKSILNVDLGQAFKSTSTIVTNDTGLQWLDTLKDGENRYMLQRDPASPMALRLCAGTATVPVVVIPNAVLANDTTHGTPFFIGDLKEAIILFDRKQLSIMTSDTANVGSGSSAINAFEQDMTIFRAIERIDVICKDEQAYYKGFYQAAQG